MLHKDPVRTRFGGSHRFEPVIWDLNPAAAAGASRADAAPASAASADGWADDFHQAAVAIDARRVALTVSRRVLARVSGVHEARISNVVGGQAPASYRDLHNLDLALDLLATRPLAQRSRNQVVRHGDRTSPQPRYRHSTDKSGPRARGGERPRPPPARAWAVAAPAPAPAPASAPTPDVGVGVGVRAVPRDLAAVTRAWRQHSGASEADLAQRLGHGVTAREVAMLESRRLAPRSGVLARLRDVLRDDGARPAPEPAPAPPPRRPRKQTQPTRAD